MNFNEMSINRKLLLAFLVMIILSGAGGLVTWYLLDSVRTYQESKNQMRDFASHIAEARTAEQNFLLFDQRDPSYWETKTSENIKIFHQELDAARTLMTTLQEDGLIHDLRLEGELGVLNRELLAYERNFNNLESAISRRGFKDWGLIGEMRSYVHVLLEAVSPEEQVFALTLRRHEKDYLLRKDTKYAERLNATAEAYIAYLEQAEGGHFSPEYKSESISGIRAYQQHFSRIVSIEHQIGADRSEGIMRDITLSSRAINPILDKVNAEVDTAVAAIYPQSLLILITSIIFLTGAGILLSYLLTRHLGRPLIRLDKVVNQVLHGEMDIISTLRESKRKDELGNLVNHFREMMLMLQKSMGEARAKNEKLEVAATEEAARSWIAEGLNKIGDSFKNQERSVEDFCYEILSELARYTGSSQGSIYVLRHNEKGEEVMESVACYAGERRKYLRKDFYIGEGLVGAAWIENDEIYLTEIPQGYMTIRTGLGAIEPMCIYLVPVRSERGVEAIIELASLGRYEVKEKELINKLAERLGAVIASLQMQEESRDLLNETRRMAEELRANEEEMRQNMEELEATQEESNRQREELEILLANVRQELYVVRGVIARFFKGLIIADSSSRIFHVNDYASVHLRYTAEDLRNMQLEDCFEEELQKLLEGIISDPNYLLYGFSEPQKMHLLDSFGSPIPMTVIVTRIQEADMEYTVCMFNRFSTDLSRRAIRDERGQHLLRFVRGQH